MRKLTLAIALLVASPLLAAAEKKPIQLLLPTAAETRTPPRLWGGLEPGQFAVGFRSWLLPAQGESKAGSKHSLQVSVWYPADNAGADMKFSDYVGLMAAESVAAPTDAQRAAALDDYRKLLTAGGAKEASARDLMTQPVYAHRDPRLIPMAMRPIVYIAQGNGQPAASQAILAEFLASHGYVVVTTPSVTRLTGQMSAPEEVAAKSAEQAEDIERAVGALGTRPNTTISIVGHSFGARAALLYAMHHPTNAIVSLDGGIGSSTGVESFKASSLFDAAAKLPPILHIYETNDARLAPDLTFLRSLNTAGLELQKMNSMQHADFTTLGFASLLYPDIAKMVGPASGKALKPEVLSTANRTLQFLNKIWGSLRAERKKGGK